MGTPSTSRRGEPVRNRCAGDAQRPRPRRVLPLLGPLWELSAQYAKLLAKGKSPASAQYGHAVPHPALDQALRWNLIQRNPADLVDAPRPERHEVTALSPGQVSTLLATGAGNRHEALYVVAVTGGLRLGEPLGLRWADLDWDSGTLQVRRRWAARRSTAWRSPSPRRQRAGAPSRSPPSRSRRCANIIGSGS